MKLRPTFALALVLAFTSLSARFPAAASAPPVASSCMPVVPATANAQKLRAALVAAKRSQGLRALIFGATVDGKPILRVAMGESQAGVPATTAMHFRIGMPAEQFETTMLMQLVDANQIALRDSVARWFPTYPHAAGATVRMIAASSSGFGDYVYGPANPALHIASFGDLVERNPYRTFTADELLTRSRKPYQVPKFARPGTDWAYSHTNYVMLGLILEALAHQRYAALLQRQILDPLHLRDTAYASTSAIARPVLHVFTSERGRYEDSTAWSPSWTSFSGSINSNVCDLSAWEDAFGTGKLLSRRSAAQLVATTNVGLGKNTPKLYFGLGTIVNNGWLISNGNFFGWHTATAYYPPQKIALVVTASASASTKNPDGFTNDLLEKLSAVMVPGSAIAFPSKT